MSVDYDRSTYQTATGAIFGLRSVSKIILGKLQTNIERGKPKPPMVETVVGHETRIVPNPDDPDYKSAVEQWVNEQSQNIVVYTFTAGVVDDPPAADVERLRYFFPDAPDLEIKYAWITEQLGDSDFAGLTEAIISINQVTREGVDESMSRFRSDSGLSADTGLHSESPADNDPVLDRV